MTNSIPMSKQQNTTQTTGTPSYNTLTSNIPNIKEKINFATHNIRGFNNQIKCQ